MAFLRFSHIVPREGEDVRQIERLRERLEGERERLEAERERLEAEREKERGRQTTQADTSML